MGYETGQCDPCLQHEPCFDLVTALQCMEFQIVLSMTKEKIKLNSLVGTWIQSAKT